MGEDPTGKIFNPDVFLLHGIAFADSDHALELRIHIVALADRVEIHGNAERRSEFVLTAVALADGLRLVVFHVEVLNQILIDILGDFFHLAFFDQRKNCRLVLGLCLLCLLVVVVVSVVLVRCSAEEGGPAAADSGTPDAAWQKIELGYYFNASGQAIPAAVLKGMDVSKFQGEVDWETAKNAGIDFAIIRCGVGGERDGQEEGWAQDEKQWRRNADECRRLGINFGTYV